MSIIFGMRKPAGDIVLDSDLDRISLATYRFATDGQATTEAANVGMGIQRYYTHLRSSLDSAPRADEHGNLLTMDGRLDNYQDLSIILEMEDKSASDSCIVLAAFRRWGADCFSHLTGDWAIALWNEAGQKLYLARDHAGTRTLYFERKNGTIIWSTYLDTLVANRDAMNLDSDYATLYLAGCPVRDLTPYHGIRSILPAHYVVFHGTTSLSHTHWRWMRTETTRYATDKQYEEHFLDRLGPAVERRIGAGMPIVAQLSGGMDSTAIVCMADRIHERSGIDANGVDTLSFYDDSEPSLDDHIYFRIVENMRGKTGSHVRMSFRERTFDTHDSSLGIYLLPGADSSTIGRETQVHRVLSAGKYRAILSGAGGDELLGGVPTALPELATYLVSGRLSQLSKQSILWCINSRSPLTHMLWNTVLHAVHCYHPSRMYRDKIAPWMTEVSHKRCENLLQVDVTAGSRLGFLPHTIDNGCAWWEVQEHLPHLHHRLLSRPEYRYPLLDKDLVDYLLSVPREQLIRPGQRRSLMRRSLQGIVPFEILERKRKAFQLNGPLATIRMAYPKLNAVLSRSRLADYGIVDLEKVRFTLDVIVQGHDPQWWQALLRVVGYELWLRQMDHHYAPSRAPQDMLPPQGADKIRMAQSAP